MSSASLVVAMSLGSAAVALWVFVRFPRLAPARAGVLRPRQARVRHGAHEPPRRRALRDLVRRSRWDAAFARRGRPGALLRAALRRPPWLARRATRSRPRLGRARRDLRGRLRAGCPAKAVGRGTRAARRPLGRAGPQRVRFLTSLRALPAACCTFPFAAVAAPFASVFGRPVS